MRRTRWTLILLLAASAASGREEESTHAVRLRELGVEPTAGGIHRYLTRTLPDEETRERAERLVAAFVSEDPVTRDAAARALLALPFGAGAALGRARAAHDPEVRRRAAHVLARHAGGNHLATLEAVCDFIAHERLGGFVDSTLRTIAVCAEPYVRRSARRALAATARPADGARLQAAVRDANPAVRAASAVALEPAFGDAAQPLLERLLVDADDGVRFAAAERFALATDRRCLPVLGALLDSERVEVRIPAVRLLRALTGQNFGYVAADSPARRRATAERWRGWLSKEGRSATLRIDLDLAPPLLGRTLICVLAGNRLLDIDAKGKETTVRSDLALPWGCQGLPNGHRLVAIYRARTVVEYDARGREVWKREALPGMPMSVRRLGSGNTLVSCSDSGQVLELTPEGRIGWKLVLEGRPIDARRLDNGNTLIVLYNGRRVVEVTNDGTVVWQVEGKHTPCSAQRLANGNTLIAGLEANTVGEYDRAGRKVRSMGGLTNVYEAQRLPDGGTLVSTAWGLHEFDASGREISKRALGACRAMRY